MENSNKSIHSGDVYFVNNLTQAGYQNRLAKEETIRMWAGRPGVVVSDERENSVPGGGVLVAFITRKANASDSYYYNKLSPFQTGIILGGEPATVLSTRAYWVAQSDLGKWMGRVTENDLQQIVCKIRRSGTMTQEGKALLYQLNGLETDRQSA